MEMPATEVCTYDEVEWNGEKSFQFFVWFMYDQGFSFQGLSSVFFLLITVSKNLEKIDEKRLCNFRKCQQMKSEDIL